MGHTYRLIGWLKPDFYHKHIKGYIHIIEQKLPWTVDDSIAAVATSVAAVVVLWRGETTGSIAVEVTYDACRAQLQHTTAQTRPILGFTLWRRHSPRLKACCYLI